MKTNFKIFFQTRSIIWVLFSGVILLVLLSVLVVKPLKVTTFSNTSKLARLQCRDAGDLLSLKINSSVDVIRNYAFLLANLAETSMIPPENKREFLVQEMFIRNKHEKSFNNLWCTFEPNALDGMDAQFINKMESDYRGVFCPWIVDGSFIPTSLDDYVSDFYTIPKKTKKEAITDPYWDKINEKDILMFSFSTPILLNDTVIGILGTDFFIQELIEIIDANRMVGNCTLITDKGTIVVHDNVDLIGTQVNFDIEHFQNQINENNICDEFIKYDNRDFYRVFVPVCIGNVGTPWYYIVEVPAKQIFSEDIKIIGLLSIIFILFALALYFYIKTVEKNRELHKLHSVKDKLFSVVAHDLRSPIAALMTLIEHLFMKTFDEKTQTVILQDISKRVEDVYKLLDNLLRWAKSQMHGIKVSPVYFNVQEEVNGVLNNLKNVANAKKISLENLLLEHDVFADRDLFSVIVRNFVSNAIKFTPEGGKIIINSEVYENKLIVSVIDNGIGMTPEVLNNLFRPNQTMSLLGTNNETGTGLGLLLCSDFVKAIGGKIWVSSQYGEGSTFSFTVPIKE